MAPAPMPRRYIAEMLMDRIAACKVYQGKTYNDGSPLRYYENRKEPAPMHEFTKKNLELLLHMLDEKGEKETFRYIKTKFLQSRFTGEGNKIK